MKFGPRAKLAALAALFLLPIAASLVAYHVVEPKATANYGELLLPPTPAAAQPFDAPGGRFELASLKGKWVLVVSDSGRCAGACDEKVATVRQVRLALGRNAARVDRVFVIDDEAAAEAPVLKQPDNGLVLRIPNGLPRPGTPAHDRDHIYLVDPHGDVMMRWPATGTDRRRMLKDLERLLKASQIG